MPDRPIAAIAQGGVSAVVREGATARDLRSVGEDLIARAERAEETQRKEGRGGR